MRKKVFLIDTENISSYEFVNRYDISKEDEIIFFVSENSKKISLKELRTLDECSAKKKFESVFVGTKDALDFQLVVYMTKEALNGESSIYIVSEDRGFDVAVNYLKQMGKMEVELIKSNYNDSSEGRDRLEIIKDKEELMMSMEEYVKDIIEDDVEREKFWKKIKEAPNSRRLSYVHNELIEMLGVAEGRRLYRKMKPMLKVFYLEVEDN